MLVRSDLPQPHLSVQACHAVLAATNAYGRPLATHPNLVLCAVAPEDMEREFNRLKDCGVACVGWYEPDFGGVLTAVATGLVCGEGRKEFRGYRLVRQGGA